MTFRTTMTLSLYAEDAFKFKAVCAKLQRSEGKTLSELALKFIEENKSILEG